MPALFRFRHTCRFPYGKPAASRAARVTRSVRRPVRTRNPRPAPAEYRAVFPGARSGMVVRCRPPRRRRWCTDCYPLIAILKPRPRRTAALGSVHPIRVSSWWFGWFPGRGSGAAGRCDRVWDVRRQRRLRLLRPLALSAAPPATGRRAWRGGFVAEPNQRSRRIDPAVQASPAQKPFARSLTWAPTSRSRVDLLDIYRLRRPAVDNSAPEGVPDRPQVSRRGTCKCA